MRSLISSTQKPFVPLFALFLSRLSHVAAEGFTQCYYPDGSIPTDYVWVPCTGAEFSSCCIPSEGDVCQDNGLCWYPDGRAFRGTCTDQTWNNPACPLNICVAGQEDTWVWATHCSNGGVDSFACGTFDGTAHQTANCTKGASTKTNFRTEALSSSRPTRYTSPPPVDTSLYSVYTSEYTTIISADVQTTTFTTTWESTITSTRSQTGSTRSTTGTSGGTTGTSVPINGGNSSDKKGTLTISAGVLAAAIAGPILLLALLAGLLFFLRKKRALKAAGTRIDSPPPPNGPVGRDQVTPYEVPASEAKLAGTGVGDKHVYTGVTRRPEEVRGDAYEMAVQGEKRRDGHHGAAEVSGDNWSRTGTPAAHGSVRSPAPAYSENAGPVVMPVELDGSDSFRERRNAH